MMFPVYTALTASALAFLQIYLMMSVGLSRVKTGIGIGDGGSEALALRVRRHGNLIENAPMFLILMTLVEGQVGQTWPVAAVAAVFVLARLAHAIALSKTSGAHPMRPVGAFGTVLATAGAAGYLLWLSLVG